MQYFKHRRWIQALAIIIVVFGVLAVSQIVMLQKAHSSFANYAAFRGCATVTSQTDATGTCTLANGQSITLVKFDNKWFLQGDLPVCMIGIGSHCLINWP